MLVQSTSLNAWSWTPSKTSWYGSLIPAINQWQPDAQIEVDIEILHKSLFEAAHNSLSWLFHPCLIPILNNGGKKLKSDFQLILWIALHVDKSLGNIKFSEPLSVWSPSGEYFVEPGVFDLRKLAIQINELQSPYPIALDVWGSTIDFPLSQNWDYPNNWSWSTHRPLNDSLAKQLQGDITHFFKSITYLAVNLPQCLDWVTSVTKVVIPFCREYDMRMKSSSRGDIPGVVFFDLQVTHYQLLEALIHESAHLHFSIAETEGPLINPEHQGQYKSALRTDPRPLRGIFLAYHALAYMCVLYSSFVINDTTIKKELLDLLQKRDDSAHTLMENFCHLTEHGITFFEQTQRATRYASY